MSGGADKGHGRDGTRALRQMPRAPISIADAAHAQCTEQQSSTAVAPSGKRTESRRGKERKSAQRVEEGAARRSDRNLPTATPPRALALRSLPLSSHYP
ncbi:hypothetical protein MRX96_031811 [Rhipicephalus microplus]